MFMYERLSFILKPYGEWLHFQRKQLCLLILPPLTIKLSS